MIDRAHVERLLTKLPLIESELSNPETAANQKKYRQLVREHSSLQRMERQARRFFSLDADIAEQQALLAAAEGDPELKELARIELPELQKARQTAEAGLLNALLPPDPREARNAIMEIRAGTGGAEAALFAGDLLRMYTYFVEKRGLKISLIDVSTGEMGGYKEVVLTVEGEGAYGLLQYESGGHRVQRVPETEAQGRIHTSAATVAVFPEADDDDDVEIKPDELRIDLFCASGSGGQSVNTTYSAVRITHLPTGTVAQSQDERSQQRNRQKAMAVLKARLLDARRKKEEEAKGNIRRSLTGTGDRSERIRTYNFPQNRMTDHRINMTIYSLDRFIEGQMDDLLESLRAHDVGQRLEEQMKKGAG